MENQPKEPVAFKYNTAAYRNGAFVACEERKMCDCCGNPTEWVYQGPFYTSADKTPTLCPHCIASGEACRRYDAFLISPYGTNVTDKDRIKELSYCTPPYYAWQEPYFPSCCGDFCTFIDDVCAEDLHEMGIYDEVVETYEANGGDPYDLDYIDVAGSPAGYLFRCLHCGKYHVHIDYD